MNLGLGINKNDFTQWLFHQFSVNMLTPNYATRKKTIKTKWNNNLKSQ